MSNSRPKWAPPTGGGLIQATDERWVRDSYQGSIVFNADAKLHDVDRSAKVYPKPRWDGMFVILVDDGDTATPPDREGQVNPR